MPTPIQQAEKLRHVSSLRELIPFLRDELDWPIDQDASLETVTYEYETEELGIDAKYADAISEIRQLRPLANQQPWGIFWVSFKKKALPVVVLRKILASLVEKKRASANSADRASWREDDLLFISAYGEEQSRELAIAHFEDAKDGTKPSLKVLQWDASDTTLKLERVLHDMQQKLRWHEEYQADPDRWRQEWASAFRTRIGHVIRTADTLADALAALARRIRDRAIEAMKSESDRGPLKQMLKAFQESLIHDLDEEGFADTYAQTVTYGLLTAAFSRTEMSEGRHGTAFEAEDITHMVPVTNPFLKEMLGAFLTVGGRKGKIDFDELGIGDVVDLLKGDETDLPAIMADFGNKTRGEDPVIHFYEHFLAAYNKKLKVQRGVFYTPQPVVSYIVRSVHELLQTEFGLEDGLASTATWGEMLERLPDLKLPTYTDEKGREVPVSKDEPFVLILDPATGTATFIVETIDVIYSHLTDKWKKARMNDAQRAAAWNDYVPKHLLPRLFAYELMMAPYAIAHMKVGLKLAETGYQFGSEERVRIYLTNALEPAQQQLRLPDFEPLAHEAEAVNRVKREKRFTIVIGNPPYSISSQNNGSWIVDLVSSYKRVVRGERNIQPLSDDYVKFFAIGHNSIETTKVGILAYITNHTFLSGLIHRGMREELIKSFSNISVVDLNGSTLLGIQLDERGNKDQNVFDIQQGVAITLARKVNPINNNPDIRFISVVSDRATKYSYLLNNNCSKGELLRLSPAEPNYFFLPTAKRDEIYDSWVKLDEIFEKQSTGLETGRDETLVSFDRASIDQFCNDLHSPVFSEADLGRIYSIADTSGWPVSARRKALQKRPLRELLDSIQRIQYRLFDKRFTPYCGFLRRSQFENMRHMLTPNLGLVATRMIKGERPAHFFVTNSPIEKILISPKTSNNAFLFPLYINYDNHSEQGLDFIDSKAPNFLPTFVNLLANNLSLSRENNNGLPCDISAEDIFSYIYAIFYSPTYRSCYSEFLKIDFPRLPLTGSPYLFKELSHLGGELVSLHLLESKLLENPRTIFMGSKSQEVEKISYKEGAVFFDKAQTTGFKVVPENVWNFHIGGYQVCEKWLKDRKGRTLSDEDIAHYHKIVIALSETIRLMAEIDQVIEKHGGWPGAFATTKSTADAPAQPTPAASKTKAKSKPQTDLGLHLEGELPL
jgi:Type ISP C-terminal specificity domain